MPYELMAVKPTDYSIAEYEIATDTIILWAWFSMGEDYAKPGESALDMIVRIISHEELHRILFKVEGEAATFAYDNISETDIEGLN